VWRDGAVVIDQAPVTRSPGASEPLDATFFGIYGYNNSGPADVWLDDLALSATRIGCAGR
jgi:hypothetical protein